MYLTSNNIPWKRYIFMQFWPPQTCVIWVMAVDISYKIDKDAMAWVRWFDVRRYLISVLLYYLYLCHLIYKIMTIPTQIQALPSNSIRLCLWFSTTHHLLPQFQRLQDIDLLFNIINSQNFLLGFIYQRYLISTSILLIILTSTLTLILTSFQRHE